MSDSVEGPGETLQAARQAMEISCREVAEALNLPVHTVEAIEANDYERLPAAVFTRGYIRAYAKLLELDSDPVVARYPSGNNETQTGETAQARHLERVLRDRSQVLIAAGIALAVVVLVAGAVWLWPTAVDVPATQTGAGQAVSSGPADNLAEDESAEAESAVDVQADARSEEPDRAGGDVAVNAESPAPVTPTAALSDPVAGQNPAGQSVDDDPAVAVALAQTPAGVRRITPTGSDRLSFEFSEDCWIEVKSATGANLYSDISRAGRTLELIGQAPFRILLGYAPGVAMTFNDETVALGPHTRNNVATLVLGQ